MLTSAGPSRAKPLDMFVPRPFSTLLAFALACGPQVPIDDAGGSSGDPTGGPGETGGGASQTSAASTTGGMPGTTVGTVTTVGPGDTTLGGTGATIGDEDAGDIGGDFITIPDGGGVCGPRPPDGTLAHGGCCDVWAQDCASDSKCVPWANDGGTAWNSTRCVPIDGSPAQVGDPCSVDDHPFSGFDDCDLGLMCAFVDPDTLDGVCVPNCTGSPQDPVCEVAGDTCFIAYDGPVALCVPQCDPLVDDCALGACVPSDDTFGCFIESDTIAPGEPCEHPGDCAPGAACVPEDTAGPCGGDTMNCCASVCDLSQVDPDAACLPGQTCTPWYRPGTVMPPQDAIGICTAG